MTLRIDDLTTFAQFQQVERLEAEIWGPMNLVPVPIMAVTVKRGAVLWARATATGWWGSVFVSGIGGENRTITTTTPRWHDATTAQSGAPASMFPSHWSHTLGVDPDFRGARLGRDLKLAQRERVLALGLDLIEWTYHPTPGAQREP